MFKWIQSKSMFNPEIQKYETYKLITLASKYIN